MDWSLLACGRAGHVTYAPDESELREQLGARTASGQAWRCLRCAAFVTGEPSGAGPAAQAPAVRRGKEVRSALVLRVFAVERYLRALVFGTAAYVVWRFRGARESIEQAYHREYPIVRSLFRELGYNVDRSKLVGLIQRALTLSSRTIALLAALLAAYAVVELVEGTGLWLSRRWGEYFAMVVTSVFLPYEIYDMTAKLTVTRALLFAVNLALVLYLVITRRLFGVRGGKRAYEARLRSESVMDAAARAAAAAATEPAPAPAGGEQAGPGPADGSLATGELGPAKPAAAPPGRDRTTPGQDRTTPGRDRAAAGQDRTMPGQSQDADPITAPELLT
jgi:uncharacterized membrane protein (DUF2068 family)